MNDHGQDARPSQQARSARPERRLISWDEKQSLRRQRHAGRHAAHNIRLIHGR